MAVAHAKAASHHVMIDVFFTFLFVYARSQRVYTCISFIRPHIAYEMADA